MVRAYPENRPSIGNSQFSGDRLQLSLHLWFPTSLMSATWIPLCSAYCSFTVWAFTPNSQLHEQPFLGNAETIHENAPIATPCVLHSRATAHAPRFYSVSGLGRMMSRIMPFISAQEAMKPRKVLRVAPKLSNSS